jgi:hypothetical protein
VRHCRCENWSVMRSFEASGNIHLTRHDTTRYDTSLHPKRLESQHTDIRTLHLSRYWSECWLVYCVRLLTDSESTVDVIWRRSSGRLIVNDKSGAMTIESAVTYFRTKPGVNGRTKETIKFFRMPDTLYRLDLGASRCKMFLVHSFVIRLYSFRNTDGNHDVLQWG